MDLFKIEFLEAEATSVRHFDGVYALKSTALE
jgi:hypothetical protein